MEKNEASFWQERIKEVKNSPRYTAWIKTAETLEKRYRNEEMKKDSDKINSLANGYPLLYSNYKTLKPYLCPYIPCVIVDRANKDKDDVARVSSEILERCVNEMMERGEFKAKMDSIKFNSFIAGLGTLWIRYEPEFEKVPVMNSIQVFDDVSQTYVESEQPALDEKGSPILEDVIEEEKICFDFVAWRDFFFNAARTRDELEWCARRVYMTKEDFEERFPNAELNDFKFMQDLDTDKTSDKKAEVFEIWDKNSEKVYFYCEQAETSTNKDVLEVNDYPYDLSNGFPCDFLEFDDVTDSLIPTPINAQVLNQYQEIDNLTARISSLIPTIKLAGGYDSSLEGFAKIFDAKNENALVPISQAEKYVEKGGLAGAITWVPVETAMNVLNSLIQSRNQLIQDVQRTLGIAGILEGQTNAQEAYGTNKLKGSFGTMRVQDMQAKVNEFMNRILIIAAEIMCQTFQPESLMALSNIQYTNEDPTLFEPAIQLLKDEQLRDTRIDIETEAMKSYYDEEYRARINEFFSTLVQDLQVATQISQAAPSMSYVFKEIIMAKVRAQRVGRTFESAIEKSMDKAIAGLEEQMANPQPPSPTPDKMADLQSKQQIEAQKAQLKAAEMQQKTQADMQKESQKLAVQMKEHQDKMDIEVAKLREQSDVDAADLAIKQADLALKNKELESERELSLLNIRQGGYADTNLG